MASPGRIGNVFRPLPTTLSALGEGLADDRPACRVARARASAWFCLAESDTLHNRPAMLANAVHEEMAAAALKEFLKDTGAQPFPPGPVDMRNHQLEGLARIRCVAEGAGIRQ